MIGIMAMRMLCTTSASSSPRRGWSHWQILKRPVWRRNIRSRQTSFERGSLRSVGWSTSLNRNDMKSHTMKEAMEHGLQGKILRAPTLFFRKPAKSGGKVNTWSQMVSLLEWGSGQQIKFKDLKWTQDGRISEWRFSEEDLAHATGRYTINSWMLYE